MRRTKAGRSVLTLGSITVTAQSAISPTTEWARTGMRVPSAVLSTS